MFASPLREYVHEQLIALCELCNPNHHSLFMPLPDQIYVATGRSRVQGSGAATWRTSFDDNWAEARATQVRGPLVSLSSRSSCLRGVETWSSHPRLELKIN